MGQYHIVANLDKKELLHPHQFGDGLKMLEFGHSGYTMTGLTILLACSHNRGGGDLHVETETPITKHILGRWAGDRIAIIGDYSQPDDYPGLDQETIDAVWNEDIHGQVGFVDISEHVVAALELDRYIHEERFAQAYSHTPTMKVRDRFGGINRRSDLHEDGTITRVQMPCS
jgi:hypothetical protein